MIKKYKIKIGDKVIVTVGECKGQIGEVISIDRKKYRVFIGDVNMVSKHEKPNSKNPKGGIIKKEASIHFSNIALVDSKSGKPTRVGYEIKNGKKVRISKKSKEVI